MDKKSFIESVAKSVIKYAPKYGIKVNSPIIAQAILESGWGKSKLASKYNNYFGMKCGSSWSGKSVNMDTEEEYTKGDYTKIKANFRVFDDMDSGIKGYFDFINKDRYNNLKGITDPKKYLETIKKDGYATSSSYVKNLLKVIKDNNLTKYDKQAVKKVSKATVDYTKVAQDVIKGLYGNGSRRKLKLKKAGYDFNKVQAEVNKILSK